MAVPVGYLLGRQLAGRVAGWLSALLLGFSAYNGLMASFARPYILEQVFFLLALFFGWLYLGEAKDGARWPLFAALLLALGCHRFALQLFPVLGIFFLVGSNRKRALVLSNLPVVAVLLAVCWLFFFWHPDNAHSGRTALELTLGGLDDKLSFFRQLHRYLPLGGLWLLVLPITALLNPSRILWSHIAGFFLSLVALSLLAPADNPRYMAHLFAWAAVLSAVAVVLVLAQAARCLFRRQTSLPRRLAVMALLVLGVGGGVAYGYRGEDARNWFGSSLRYVDQGPACRTLKHLMGPDDTLISVDPGITFLYLGRDADYFLRERVDARTGTHRPFTLLEKGNRPDYFIDSPERLLRVLNQNRGRRVWLYANWKITWAISPEMDRLVRQ
ncbi:MAG: hypothetical protein D6751_05570, partial [Deltaproteobacteria bacterium]